ncbi:MAG: nicotinate-nucleotide adenylyltransferase [Betaproteobacteria bacterium]|nr:MAG: nicotinate-nucleotide adenylyltransferase [Betaproteobacteria bacterium]
MALLGGTFDPIHYGHLRTAAEVRSALDFAEARLIPAGNPPHRPPPVASAEHRLAMTEIGCAEFPGLMADGREVRNPRLSYTVSTLQDLHSEQPKLPLALIVGTDAFANLILWHHWEQLFTLAHLVVVERPGAALDIESLPPALKIQWERRLTTDPARLSRQLAGAIYRQAVTPQPISGTALRDALARGGQARAQLAGLLPAAVLAYIDRNQLYRSRQDAP